MANKSVVYFLLFALLLLFNLSSCISLSGGETVNTNNYSVRDGEDYDELSIIVPGEPDITRQNDRVLSELEKRTNTRLTILNPTWDSYNEKVNLLASTGELPDIICNMDHTNRTILDYWIRNGLIIPFSKEMKTVAPDIVRQYDEVPYYKELLWDGEIYFQPIWFRKKAFPNRGLFHVRKDLLDQLDLALPDTLEEIYRAMKIMKEELGIYGLVYGGELQLSGIAGAFGLPFNGWIKDENEDYIFANVQPEMLEALKWVKKLYQENLVDPESPTLVQEQAEQRYFNGQAGFIIFNGGAHITRYADFIKEIEPDGQEWLLPAPAGKEGKRGYVSEVGFYGVSMISSNTDNPVAAAKFMNYLVSDEGQRLTIFGVEGIHYEEQPDGTFVINEIERAKEGEDHWDAGRYHQLAAPFVSWVDEYYQDWWSFYGKDQSYIEWYYQMLNNQGRYQIDNEIMVACTPKWVSFDQINVELWDEYSTKIILGIGDPDKLFEEFVQKWNDLGGDIATAEMSEAARAFKDIN